MTDNNNIKIQKEEPDLYKRSIKGGFWVMSSRFLVQFLGFLKSLFIVNFFLLNDLGIISAAVMMMEILNMFTQTGFESALIQKKGDIHDYLDTAWTAGIIKGIVLFLILYFAAPLLATFRIPEEKVPLAIGVFRVMAISFLIGGFRNIGAIYFSKNLDFHKTFTLSMVSTLTDILLTVALVLIFRSIWGVIASRLVSASIGCVGSYVLSSYRPKLHFERTKARELWTFGRWIFGQNILGYLLEAGDDYFVWFYLGIQPLALYRYAYRFSTMPATHIAHVISLVSYPAYSKIQGELSRLKDAYLKVLTLTSLLSVPMSLVILVLGPDFVNLFLPPRMYPMIPVLQILAFKGMFWAVGATRGPLIRAMGKPNALFYNTIIRVLIMAATIYPLAKQWGIAGVAISTLVTGLLVSPLDFRIIQKLLKVGVWELYRPLIYAFAASVGMAVFLIMLKSWLIQTMNFFYFFLLIFIGIGIYCFLMYILDLIFNLKIRKTFIEIMAVSK